MSRNRPPPWRAFVTIALAGGTAVATPPNEFRAEDESPDNAGQQDPEARQIRIGPPSMLSAGIGAHAGIFNQWVVSESRAHGLIGGDLYLRYFYVEARAFLELSDSGEAPGLFEVAQESSRTAGGALGAWLPIEGSIDGHASLGYAVREFVNPSELYGPSGLSAKTHVLELRIGITDRSTERLLGARVGAWIVSTMDMDPHDATWRRTFLRGDGTTGTTTGTTRIGGFSLGLAISAAFEIGGR